MAISSWCSPELGQVVHVLGMKRPDAHGPGTACRACLYSDPCRGAVGFPLETTAKGAPSKTDAPIKLVFDFAPIVLMFLLVR